MAEHDDIASWLKENAPEWLRDDTVADVIKSKGGWWAPGSQGMKRSIAEWCEKLSAGREALQQVWNGVKTEAAIEEAIDKNDCSRRYVIDAMAMAKSLNKRLPKTSLLKLDRRKLTATAKARQFLIVELRDGPKERETILKAAKRFGIAARTLERAYAHVGNVSPGKRSATWELSVQQAKYLQISRQFSRKPTR